MNLSLSNSPTQHTTWRTIIYLFSLLVWSGIKFFTTQPHKVKGELFQISPNEIRMWIIGHASVLINFSGTTILTDPIFDAGLPFPKRITSAAYSIEELPKIDVLILSHAHLDHWHTKSLKRLTDKTSLIVIPKNCRDLLNGLKYQMVTELDWNQRWASSSLTITAYKPNHWGERFPWERANRGYNSYVIEKDGRGLFFCGDSGYDRFFKTVAANHNIDVALLPISAYNPPPFRQNHMNPVDALQAFSDLKARHLIPIHWGNFQLSLEPFDEPPNWIAQLAKEKGLADRVHILKNGKSWKLEL